MAEFLEQLKKEANKTYTENGAAAYFSTESSCLDLFADAGALRSATDEDILKRFIRAYAENPDYAMRILFYARDIRGGLGERRFFRVILSYLAEAHKESVIKNLEKIAEYGRFDDLLSLMNTPCEEEMVEYIGKQLEEDIISCEKGGEVSLLAKWLPSVNASCGKTVRKAKLLAKNLGFTDEKYRKTLSKLRAYIKIVENNLRERDYTFDYEKQPSKALFKYRKAFARNDGERYYAFLEKTENGEAKLNTGTLMPYEIIHPFFERVVSQEETRSIDATWNALEDFGGKENAIAVIDGSGSMYCNTNPRPIEVAMSLGIYFAERNKGAFANHFITFSENPRIVEIKGDDILEKVRCCASYNEVANTNIQRVFELILQTALKNRCTQNELPEKVYIISDMEFDYCTEDSNMTNFEYAKKLFERHGYRLPQIVFWNVQSRQMNHPVTKNKEGVVLVSGCSPSVFKMVAGGSANPYKFMVEILESDRYKNIAA